MCSLLLGLDHLVVLVKHCVPFPLHLLFLYEKDIEFVLFLLKDDMLLFVFKLKTIQVINQMGVFLCLDIIFNTNTSLILAGVSPQCSNCTFHIVKLLIKLLNSFWITLFSIVLVCHLTLDIILVEFHETCNISLIILKLDNFLNVLCEFKDDSFLFLRLVLLLSDVDYDLVDFGLMFS